MISWPYTKLMNSNNMVDQGAALILTSVEAATRLGIPTDRWVFPYAGTDAHDTYSISERAELHRSPAIRIGGARALELAGLGIDDMDHVDLYSCFPSAVQVAATELGLPVDDPARPADGHRRADFRRRAMEQLRRSLHRDDGRTADRQSRPSRVDHRQRRLPDQAQLRRIRHRAAPDRIPLGGRATRGGPRADPDGRGGVGRRRHRRVLDDTVRPRWSAREGFPVGSHAGRTAHAGVDHRPGQRPRHTVHEDIGGAKVTVHADGSATLQ